MFKTIYFLSFFLLLCTGFAQSKQMPFKSMGAGRMEVVKVGGLYDIELSYEFRINEEGFFLDTVKLDKNQVFGYKIENIDFLKNKLSETEYNYQLFGTLTKTYLGQTYFSDRLSFDGLIYIEGENVNDFSVVHELTNVGQLMNAVVIMQYFFRVHEWLLLVSIILLLILKTPLNLRHGLIIAIPLMGPGVYITKETIRLIRTRKKKGNKRKAQSTQHQQSATHALES